MATNQPEIFSFPGGKARSRVWKYFGFLKKKDGPPIKENLDMDIAICRICCKTYANKGHTTNLAFHLDHDHRGNLEEESSVEKGSGSKAKASKNLVQKKLETFKQGHFIPPRMSDTRKSEIDEILMKLMVQKVLPLSLVENENFIKLLNILDPRYKAPSRKELLKMLQRKEADIHEKIENDLKNISSVSITHDGWTSMSTESYSTITGHFITNDWQLRSVSLETTKVSGSHTAENISSVLSKAQNKWNLPQPIAVTDNAANEKKAIDLLGWTRFGCYGHRINLVVQNALKEPAIARLIGKGRKLVTFFHQSFSATDLLSEKQALLGINKARLINDVPTRWNSTHAMLRRISDQTAAVVAVANDSSLNKQAIFTIKNNCFDFNEQDLAQKVVDLLEPFENATNSVSSEKEPTMQKILPILCKIGNLLNVTEDDPTPIRKMKEIMSKELESRTQDRDLCLLAAILNPYAKSMSFLTEEEKNHAKDLLHKEVFDTDYIDTNNNIKKEKNSKSTVQDQPDLPQAPAELSQTKDDGESDKAVIIQDVYPNESISKIESEPPSPKKYKQSSGVDDWFGDVVFVKQTCKPREEIASEEVNRYLLSQVIPTGKSLLEWWEDNENFYPRLSKVAKKFLAVPASSIPSERIFSLCGNLVTKKRARLAPSTVEMLVFLNRNMEVYW